jgi:uncharacterized SAM-binding protein YcdF (DUF218 family)
MTAMTNDAVSPLFVREQPDAADLCIVFGHHDPHTSAMRVRHAARLYVEGLVPRLLVTGGATAPGCAAEAELMATVAVAAGVQSEDVLVEPLARTTAENVSRSAALLRERGLLTAVATVLLVSCPYHMGRVKLLAQAGFPRGVRFLACPHDGGHTAETWHQSAEGRKCVVAELALYNAVVRTLAESQQFDP